VNAGYEHMLGFFKIFFYNGFMSGIKEEKFKVFKILHFREKIIIRKIKIK
jgi:hypothetical protein